ncbi:MAG: protein-disulfide reductase DsbD N-terminal domain-containing protein [Acidobacteriota bacterium]|nr:protein-disulfide reductase DsbD N-terminal domain-containing protein [Acidobacteriota bacterium]
MSALLLAQNSPLLNVAPPEPISTKPGSAFTAKVSATLSEGFHLNSHTPPEDFLIPLSLTWTPGPIAAVNVQYPRPQLLKLPFSPKPLSVLTGKFVLETRFKVVPGTQPGPTTVIGKLRYQACNDKACFPPKNVEVKLPVIIE